MASAVPCQDLPSDAILHSEPGSWALQDSTTDLISPAWSPAFSHLQVGDIRTGCVLYIRVYDEIKPIAPTVASQYVH